MSNEVKAIDDFVVKYNEFKNELLNSKQKLLLKVTK